MRDTTESNTYTAADVRLAVSEIYPALDQYDALEVYRAYDDGGLEEIPQALAAYVDFHQRQWL